MASKIEAAYIDEIGDLEARMASDANLLAILKRGLADYRAATAGVSASGSTASISAKSEVGAITVAVTPSTRARSPERQAILDATALFLRTRLTIDRTAPCRTRWILEHLTSIGIEVPGNNPINNLSAMLSNAPGFIAHGKRGWTLAENENPADAETLASEASNGGIEDQTDHLVEPPAQGREAVPGGGT